MLSKKIIVTFAVMAFIPSLFSAPQGFIEKCQNTFFTLWRPFVLFPGFLDDSKPKTCATHTLQKHTTGPLGLLDLPDEMLLHIISFLHHPNDYLDLALSCTRFYGLMQDPKALAFFVAKFPDPSLDQTLGWQVTLEKHAEIFFEYIEKSEEGLKLSKLFHSQHNIASLSWAIKELRKDDDYSGCYFSGRFYYSSCEFKSELCKSLRYNKTLTVLNLSGDKLRDADGIALAESLKTNTTLTVLDLSYNYLRDDAGKAFAKALQINHCLRELDFSDNEFINETGIAFLEALKQNKTLKVLNLTCNPSLNISSWAPLHQLARSKGIKIHVGDLRLLRS